MASYNKVQLLGNLTRDIDLKSLDSGKSVGEFGMAMNEYYIKENGEKVDTPVFVDVTVWGKQAETCSQYISKGSQVFVDGKLKLDQWQGEDGTKRQKIRVVADRVLFIGGRKENYDEGDAGSQEYDDDIPF